jgi:Zn-dependent oligopeptidase
MGRSSMLMRLFQEKEFSQRSTKFKDNVLSKGGTELPMELYKIQRSRTKSRCVIETCWVDIDQC